MAVFTAERTARKDRLCNRCGGAIKAGERYASISITPGGEMGYLGWSRLAEHLSPTACEYELAALSAHDAADWLGLGWSVPLDENGQYAGEAKEA